MAAPVGTRAVLLRAHAYGETSRILRFYTEDRGLLSVMARGVRGRSGKGGLTLSTFATGDLTAFVRTDRDLHTMKDFVCTRLRARLGAGVLRFAGASAVGELVVAHTDAESHPEVFHGLERALDDLEEAPDERVPGAVLAGAWGVVAALGFAPELTVCTRCGELLGEDEVGRFDFASGGVLCAACAEGSTGPRLGPRARAQIRDLVEGRHDEGFSHARIHLGILSDFVSFHVAQRPLKSFRFLGDVLPAEVDP